MAWRLLAGICSSLRRVAKLFVALVDAGEAEQLVLDLVDGAFGAGDLEQASCVTLDA